MSIKKKKLYNDEFVNYFRQSCDWERPSHSGQKLPAEQEELQDFYTTKALVELPEPWLNVHKQRAVKINERWLVMK